MEGNRTIVVLGMHRSGTSMVTGSLARAGLFVGATEALLADQDDNPLGFWERRDVVALNNEILECANGVWFSPTTWKKLQETVGANVDALSKPPAALIKQIKGDAASCNGSPVSLVLKDPRMVVTWPLWDSAITEPVLVYVYRDPMAVAHSLAKRHDFPLMLGLALWEIYNRYALTIISEKGGIALAFESVQSSPERTLEALEDHLRALGVVLPAPIDTGAYDSHQPSSHTKENQCTGKLLSSSQAQLKSLCSSVCGESAELVAPRSFAVEPPASSVFDIVRDLSSALAPLASAKETLIELKHEQETVQERTEERDRLIAQLTSTEQDFRNLVELHEAQVVDHSKLVAANDQLHSEFEALAQLQKDIVAEKSVLNARLTEREKDFVSLAHAHDKEVSAHQTTRERFESLSLAVDEIRHARDLAISDANDMREQLKDMTAKADWLFDLLTTTQRHLMSYELSFMGTVGRWARKGFRFATFRRGRITEYEQALAEARQFFSDHSISEPIPPPRKWRQVKAMASYTLANPVSALRSVSFSRLRKVLQVVRQTDPQDLEVWVNARFPEAQPTSNLPEISEFDPDSLLVLNPSAQPTVSIIVPVYNEYPVTMRCLASIAEFSTVPYEVILADDCSTDETATITDRVDGLQHIRHEQNMRFLKNCNAAAKYAKGDFLLFLNNDTTVTEGYLEALLAPMKDPSIGVTGPKLLFPDGKLQEAGGIIWRDASGWNFGRADNPELPKYNYRRETDYVSGAALMIRASLWQSIGGFDETFAPAYYEDTDLCFAARDIGFKVVYEPTATVVHYEGLSNGTDLASGQKQYQVVNAEKFATKWRETLDKQHFPNAEHVIYARDRSRDKRCVLVMDHYVPHYDKDAGSRSTYGYVKLLVESGYRVQFMGANFFPHQPYTDELRALGVEVLVGEPIARGLDAWLSEHLPYVDHILLHRPHIAEQFLPHLKKQKICPPITYIGHDLHFLRTQREAELTANEKLLREANKWQKREFDVFKQVQNVLYFSDVEIDEIHKIAPEQTALTIPLYVLDALEVQRRETECPELLFVAGFNHPPNIDAAIWFVQDIFPLIKESLPDVQLHIVGSNPSSKVLALASDAIKVHGYVSDEELTNLYSMTACAVVPLRFGAGVKGKVLEAIQHCVPLVTTSVGAEGIPNAETVMYIADQPLDFASSVIDAIEKGVDHNVQKAWVDSNFSRQRALAALQGLIGAPVKENA